LVVALIVYRSSVFRLLAMTASANSIRRRIASDSALLSLHDRFRKIGAHFLDRALLTI